jgi:hypothetical protein
MLLLLVGGVLPLLGAFLAASPVAAQGSLGRMKIGTSGGLNTAIQPVLYAKSAGLFEKVGLAVETTDMVDDTTAVQALIASSTTRSASRWSGPRSSPGSVAPETARRSP